MSEDRLVVPWFVLCPVTGTPRAATPRTHTAHRNHPRDLPDRHPCPYSRKTR